MPCTPLFHGSKELRLFPLESFLPCREISLRSPLLELFEAAASWRKLIACVYLRYVVVLMSMWCKNMCTRVCGAKVCGLGYCVCVVLCTHEYVVQMSVLWTHEYLYVVQISIMQYCVLGLMRCKCPCAYECIVSTLEMYINYRCPMSYLQHKYILCDIHSYLAL